MFANTKALAVIAACTVAAQAQTTASATAPPSQSSLPAGLDTCILGCVTEAATQNGCASFTDLKCVCTSTAFQGAALACLQANCTAQDVTAATQLQMQECAAFMSSASAPASTAASPTASKSAAGLSAGYSFEALFGALVASAGALIGGALVL